MNRHNAPPVIYPLGRSPFLGGLLLALWLAGLFSVLLWWNVTRQPDWRMLLSGFSVLLAGFAARITWDNLPGGQLAWDGDVWRWESAGYQTGAGEHALSVIADFQHQLLLRLENQDGARLWLWVEKNTMSERWMDLRRAVYSPHRSRAALPAHDLLSVEPSDPTTVAVAPSKAMPSQHVTQATP